MLKLSQKKKKKKSGLNITPNDVILNIKTMLFWGELTFNRHLINGYGRKRANPNNI